MNPLVSVCTTSYKHAPFLSDYFEGLLAQNYRPLEVVFVDDCSPDDTQTVVAQYEDRLRNAGIIFKPLRNVTNLGVHKSCDIATSAAEGEYIAWLEGDDFFYPSKIEESVEFLKHFPDMVGVHTDFDRLCGEDMSYECWRSMGRQINNPTPYEQILGYANTVMTCTLVVRRDIWNECPGPLEWERRGYVMGDFPSVLWISKRYQLGYYSKALSVYRVHGGGMMSAQADKVYHSGIKIMEDAHAGLI